MLKFLGGPLMVGSRDRGHLPVRPCWRWVREGVAPLRGGGPGVSPPEIFEFLHANSCIVVQLNQKPSLLSFLHLKAGQKYKIYG